LVEILNIEKQVQEKWAHEHVFEEDAQWNDDDVCIKLDEQAKLDFHSASSLKQ
jgi:leucyl-tRNA synthetase